MAREQVKRKQAAPPVEIGRGVLVRGGRRIADDAWIVLDDEAPAPANGDIVVSLGRFQRERESLRAREGKLGLLLNAADAVEEMSADAAGFALIMVQFPVFRDGRGLSTARLLRERYKYSGELRAVGDVREDQVFFMLRCGFDAFEIIAADPEAVFARASRTFRTAYQAAADLTVPAFRLRARPAAPRLVHERPKPAFSGKELADYYTARVEGFSARDVLAFAARDMWPGKFALVSSFGAESAVLLHLASTIDTAMPVIFLETERHFAQTLQYRDDLVARLGLTNVIVQTPDAQEASVKDARDDLWRRDPDACCALRKVRPLGRALAPYEAWATGRKRFQGGRRATLQLIEHDGRHFKVNPLALWSPEDIAAYIARHDLPAHPLVAQGFPSIGCWPCTKAAPPESRAGRWAHAEKTECGIHTLAGDGFAISS